MDFKVYASSSSGNLYTLSDGQTNLILEAGLPFKKIQIALNFNISKMDAVLCTHEHFDHSLALKDLAKAGVDCYLTKPTADALGLNGHRFKFIEPLKQFAIKTFVIMPFPTQHDAALPVGYVMHSQVTGEKMAFITDSFYCKYRFKGLTHIAIECNYALDILNSNIEAGAVPAAMKNRLLQSHFSLANVKEFLKANDLSRVTEIHMLHLSDGNSNAERFKREIQELTGKVVYVAETKFFYPSGENSSSGGRLEP